MESASDGPSAHMAMGGWGTVDADCETSQTLGLKYDDIRQAYENYRRELRER
mgnify:CR=1 FL=1